MLATPENDKGFVSHPMHGEEAQRRLMIDVTRYVPRQRIAIDVGAHIGLATLPLAASFKHVFAFEPQAENFDALRMNTFGRDNITTYRMALGCGEYYESLDLPDDYNSGCYYLKLSDDYLGRVAQPLDRFGFCDVDLIKLDVEGFEGRVLQGAEDTLKRNKPVVFFEDNGLGLNYYGESWVDPKDVLRSLGYMCYKRVQKNELWLPST
jgi:FkbM family methyltransferase